MGNEDPDLKREVEELEIKNRDLKITNQAKDQIIGHTEKQFKIFLNDAKNAYQQIGRLEAENKLLRLPPKSERVADEPRIHEVG